MRFPFCQFIAAKPTFEDSCKCSRKVKPGPPYFPEYHARCHTAAEVAEAQEKVPVAATENRSLNTTDFRPLLRWPTVWV